MKFLCLGYLDEATFDAIPDGEKAEILNACFAQCVPFRATGKVVLEEGVQSSDRAKTLRSMNGETAVTDGPLLPTKQQIGSLFLIEAETMEEAIAVASLHPAARMGEVYGFGIEIRPLQ